MAKLAAIALAVVLCVALADAIANPQGTKVVTGAAVSAEQSALNAELGKTTSS